MVAKMMRWRPWLPLAQRKFEVRLVVVGLSGVRLPAQRVAAEVRWKGAKAALSSLRRSVRRNRTRDAAAAAASAPGEVEGEGGREEGVGRVEWNEEFRSVCALSVYKDGAFLPWEISFAVFNDLSHDSKNRSSVVGTASLNLAHYATSAEEKEIDIPLSLSADTTDSPLTLHLAISLMELRTTEESSEIPQKTLLPISSPPNPVEVLNVEKDEFSALRAGLRKVRILRELVSNGKSKKNCNEDEGSDEKCSAKSEDADYTYPFDTESLDEDFDKDELETGKEESNIRKSFSYGTLASANYVGGSFYSEMTINGDIDDCIYYSHRKSDVGCSQAEEAVPSISELSSSQGSKKRFLSWKRRKLSFRSPKLKGEPLLKPYGEEGGDDIDFDRRQMSSSDESFGLHKVDDDTVANSSSLSDFGDDNFAIGSWEAKEVVNRDGHKKLCTQVFYASIDQRSERASGESACTALVAVIADWFQCNQNMMPIKSQFDSLIREGSLEWRNLCENETHRERFPDKHFDLETVLQAKIRPLSVVSGKSFIGFFHPESVDDDDTSFEFLNGAMSFDSIWDEIGRCRSENPDERSSQLYIVSWNDHFFILKVDPDAFYIIDTLGERLYEGCNQAYILKFDENTLIRKMPSKQDAASYEAAEPANQQVIPNATEEDSTGQGASGSADVELEVVCRGKESCKEYIKSFLAAIPIRELQADIKKGLVSSTLIHHRLQIEFHYTKQLDESMSATAPLPTTHLVTAFPQVLEPLQV